MIPKIDNCYFLSRIDSTIIANLIDGEKIPLVRFKHNFIDVLILEGQGYEYMKKYMAMHPSLWELISQEKPNQQLTLF